MGWRQSLSETIACVPSTGDYGRHPSTASYQGIRSAPLNLRFHPGARLQPSATQGKALAQRTDTNGLVPNEPAGGPAWTMGWVLVPKAGKRDIRLGGDPSAKGELQAPIRAGTRD
jgi:hypothetical protein